MNGKLQSKQLSKPKETKSNRLNRAILCSTSLCYLNLKKNKNQKKNRNKLIKLTENRYLLLINCSIQWKQTKKKARESNITNLE